jgi:hypothetical protein
MSEIKKNLPIINNEHPTSKFRVYHPFVAFYLICWFGSLFVWNFLITNPSLSAKVNTKPWQDVYRSWIMDTQDTN